MHNRCSATVGLSIPGMLIGCGDAAIKGNELRSMTREAFLKAGARSVVIGEGSHLPTYQWEDAVTLGHTGKH